MCCRGVKDGEVSREGERQCLSAAEGIERMDLGGKEALKASLSRRFYDANPRSHSSTCPNPGVDADLVPPALGGALPGCDVCTYACCCWCGRLLVADPPYSGKGETLFVPAALRPLGIDSVIVGSWCAERYAEEGCESVSTENAAPPPPSYALACA